MGKMKTKTLAYYVLLLGGIALFIAMPFAAIENPWTLLITVPLILIWGVWLLKEYWRWVYSVGK